MCQQKGFTLIEFVVIIVIMRGATAERKFIDLTGDAEEAVFVGISAALKVV